MRFFGVAMLAAWLAFCPPRSIGHAAVLDFETVPNGTVYGAEAGHVSGQTGLIIQDGIDMSVEDFFVGSFTGLVRAEVGGRHTETFASQALAVDNISLRFDFTDVGFDVDFVTLDFADFGGASNFAVNDEPVRVLNPLPDSPALAGLPSLVATGVQVDVTDSLITLTSIGESTNINSFQIGGQELVIDNITAIPEPITLTMLSLGGAAILLYRRRRIR